jgi:ribosomal protein L15
MAPNNTHEMTREGYDNLNAELEHLITVVRKENALRLKEAIALGDISENAEYDAAKDAQAETEERITEIEEILRTAVIVDETDEGDDTVQTGRTVTIKELKAKHLISAKAGRIKVLAGGHLSKKFTVVADKFSLQAVKMITIEGGTVKQYNA